ncbi:MAG: hypothetical protein RLZZ519_2787 [Bacteroidota bacterium]|jgi:hypothetical protein
MILRRPKKVLAIALLLLLIQMVGFAQRPEPKLEWRVNPLALGLFTPNLGIRVNSAGIWKPDFQLAVQLPWARIAAKDHWTIGSSHLSQSSLGYAVIFYGGLTRMKTGWGESGGRISLQLGGKAFRTGEYYWGGGSTGSACGIFDEIRINFGPRAEFGQYFALGNRFGLELFGGAGFRAGFSQVKELRYGELEDDNCVNSSGFTPDVTFPNARFSFVPTLHGGLSLVFK